MSDRLGSLNRSSLIGLLAIQLLLFLPLWSVLPYWLSLVAIVVWCWRFLLLQMRRSLPGRTFKMLLVIAAIFALVAQYRFAVRLEALVSLLCLFYCLKLLEMRLNRDAQWVCGLSFFVLGSVFLFKQSILISLYGCLVIWVILLVLIGLNRPHTRETFSDNAWAVTSLLLKASPLMVLLFILVPRVPPLWAVPLASHQGRTGLSDRIAPGDIAHLTQSDELVFRARFEGEIPDKSRLYWRALTLSEFDGRRWYRLDETQLARRMGLKDEALRPKTKRSPWLRGTLASLDYELLLEPAGSSWIYSLASVSQTLQPLIFTRDYNLMRPKGRVERASYRISSESAAIRDESLPYWLRDLTLRLPAGNPRTRQLARELRSAHSASEEKLLQAALNYFRQEPFFYTLRPPRLTGYTIDQFMFETRRGFCAHFAGGLVFVLRAAGIPARVVAGYQGGRSTRLVLSRCASLMPMPGLKSGFPDVAGSAWIQPLW
nr:DUF3488 and transglutaminase-like domain-containing protein [Dongshaea marina]